ncbi:MAG: hypothetical protein VKJ06_01080 [Vampirovibrionales bacterium]|nr:hypothetical protein [Vampirovibrionales bacterium]
MQQGFESSIGGIGHNAAPAGGVDRLAGLLDVLGTRQQLISHNVANVETPGYIAQNIDFKAILAQSNSPMETRLSQQMGRSPMDAMVNSTGEPVDLTQQFIAMQENQLAYSMAVRRITTVFTNLKSAAQIGR